MFSSELLKKPSFLLFCLLSLAIISRIPLLLPDRMILDGDEALSGLMSFHQLEQGEIPWFFWGQRYGFSFVEVSSISLFHSIIGYDDLAVKLGIMLIWLLALAGMFLFLKEKFSPSWAFGLVLLFALFPAWYYWSLKARGGYLTALAASAWLFYFVAKTNWPALLRGALAGILLAVIYHAMKLWIPSALLLMIGLLVYQQQKWVFGIAAGVTSAGIFLVLYSISLQYPNYWRPSVADLSLWQTNLALVPNRIEDFCKGNFFLGQVYPIKNWTANAWKIIKWVSLCSLVLAALQWKERKDKIAQLFFLAAALAPLSVLIITNEFFSPRYLLPAPFFILFWCAWQWKTLRYAKFIQTLCVASALVFAAGSLQLTDTDYYKGEVAERKAKKELGSQLLRDNYTYILCNAPEMHWQLMYYSGEKLICSGLYPHDRLQKFPNQVREAYEKGDRVPVISVDNQNGRGLESYFEPYGNYFIFKAPEPAQLDTMQFEMRILY